MRLLGLDYGSKTVGVAVTDPLGYTAQPLETITRKEENKLRRTLARIEQLVGEYQIEKIVLGYPVNMDGSAGERAELALAFKAMLERRTKLEVIMQDERLTTVAADEILQECGMPREKRKTVIDQVAAGLILQDFMENIQPPSQQLSFINYQLSTEFSIYNDPPCKGRLPIHRYKQPVQESA